MKFNCNGSMLLLQCACHLLAAIFERTSVQRDHMPMTRVVNDETLKLVAETTWKVIIQCRHQVLRFLCVINQSFI